MNTALRKSSRYLELGFCEVSWNCEDSDVYVCIGSSVNHLGQEKRKKR